MDYTKLEEALKFAELQRTGSKNSRNKIVSMHQYPDPIYRNNQRVAFEVPHQPVLLHPRPETANRRAYTQYPLHKIQTVDELCIREGYVRPKKTVNVAPVLLRRANTAKVNYPRASQASRALQVPKVLHVKPLSLRGGRVKPQTPRVKPQTPQTPRAPRGSKKTGI